MQKLKQGKELNPARIEPGAGESESVLVLAAFSTPEPTTKAWHELLNGHTDSAEEVQLLLQYLLLNTASGRAFLQLVARFRSDLVAGPTLEIIDLVTAYEAIEEFNRLVAEPRFGTDPTYFLWRDLWKYPGGGSSYKYKELIALIDGMERQSTNSEEIERLRKMHIAISEESDGEEYWERRNNLPT